LVIRAVSLPLAPLEWQFQTPAMNTFPLFCLRWPETGLPNALCWPNCGSLDLGGSLEFVASTAIDRRRDLNSGKPQENMSLHRMKQFRICIASPQWVVLSPRQSPLASSTMETSGLLQHILTSMCMNSSAARDAVNFGDHQKCNPRM
jgi:hypothetical protein